MQVNEEYFETLIQELERILDWHLKEADRHACRTLKDYSKIISNLCITIDTLKHYIMGVEQN